MTKKVLVEVLQEIPSVLKAEGKNDFLKYGYITLDQLKKIFHEVLAKKGLFFAFHCMETVIEKLQDGYLTIARFRAEFSDGQDTAFIETYGMAFDKEGKGLAKAKTDALKRLFTDSFLIAVGEEDEDDFYGTKQTTQEQAQNEPAKEPATEKQIKAIRALLNIAGIKEEDFKKKIGKEHLHDLTKQEASRVIEELQGNA